ncbi:hypothetical protein K1720_10200 [Thermococcus argininiproducens]|uniref:Uncharacterized protein n=1 Tax=Thermococcus argininiproducens TaxID=2866384 RepID=A0A9E7MAF2_9EURY|nr:hypothetical protein [Thermococcus argininiproducens]USG99839.1 hypothetical protein K1720_10200 [Thermococcus argininiproducens]
MGPEKFKELSQHLEQIISQKSQQTLEEALIRTTISKYYYYIFLKLREEILDAVKDVINALNNQESEEIIKYKQDLLLLEKLLTPSLPNQPKKHKDNVHQVIQRFIGEFAGKTVREALFRLRWYRNLADYHLDTPITVELQKGAPITVEFKPEEILLVKRDLKTIERWFTEIKSTHRYPIHKMLKSKEAPKKIERVI